MAKLPIGLQGFTVRDALANDFEGTLRRISDIGYEGVEIGPGSRPPAEVKKLLSALQLTPISTGSAFEHLSNNMADVIKTAQQMGTDTVMCAWMGEEHRASRDAYERTAYRLNQLGEQCREHGLTFTYHNHDFEFETFDGQTGLDILMDQTDPEYVQLELDVYWTEFGGYSALDYMKKYAGRIPLLHVKDMEDGEERFFAEVGQGVLPMTEIVQLADEIGVKWLIVEQDECRRDPLECIRTSFEFLQG